MTKTPSAPVRPFNDQSDVMQFFDLTDHGIIEASGQDASKLLQGQCTINALTLHEKEAKLSAICNREGRVISLFYLLKKEDNFYLILPADLIKHTIETLKKYAVFFKLSLNDCSTQYTLIGFYGNNKEKSHIEFSYHINDKCGFLLQKNTLAATHTVAAITEFQKQLFYYKYPRLHLTGIGKWLPYELGLLELGALDFEKGCYIGQEIIARMHYRSKRHFAILRAIIQCSHSPLYATIIDQQQKRVGSVIDSISLNNEQYLALLSIKDGIYSPPLFLSEYNEIPIELI